MIARIEMLTIITEVYVMDTQGAVMANKIKTDVC